MLKLISEPIVKMAQVLQFECGLDPQDTAILKLDGPKYLRKVQTNIKLKHDPLDDLKETEKKVLLAYVIFLRQNITIEQGAKPNEEDAAKILHGEVYEDEDKIDKELSKELIKQLEKVGIDVHANKDTKKKDKGD